MRIKFRRLVSAAVAVCLSAGAAAVTGYADTADTKVSDESFEYDCRLLSDLGILKIEQNDPNAEISRGEFADIAMRTYFKELPSVERASAFSDVIPNYEYKEAVEAGYSSGMFRGVGGGLFGVDDKVTDTEALTVMLRILGYEEYIKATASWDKAFVNTAKKIGLLDGVNISGGKITFKSALHLVCNALDISPMRFESESSGLLTYGKKENATLLYERLGIDIAYGTVTANRDAALDGSSAGSEDEISLSGKIYKVGATDAYYFLGYNVKVWFDEDDDKILHIEDNDSDLTEVDRSQDSTFSGRTLSYYVNSRKRSVDIDPTAIIVYNGSVVRGGDFDNSLFDIDTGDIKVIKNSYNGHTVVIITSYFDLIFDRFTEVDGKYVLINKFDDEQNVVIEDTDMYDIRDASGKRLKIEDIPKEAVISAAQNLDKTIGRLIVNTENSKYTQAYVLSCAADKATIKTYSEEIHTYEENTFDYTKYFEKKNSEGTAVSAGREYTAYINAFGLIAYMSQETDMSDFYAYIINMGKEGTLDETITVRVFKDDGKTADYTVAKNIKIDGILYKRSNSQSIFDALEINNAEKSRLVYMSLNYDSEIRSIDTCPTENQDRESDYSLYMSDREAEDTLYKIKPGTSAWAGSYPGRQRYSMDTKSFDSGIITDTKTIIMAVPRDDRTNTARYKIVTNVAFINDREYKVRAYGRDDDKITADIIVYEYWSRYDDSVENAEKVGVNRFARAPFQRTYDCGTAIVTECNQEINPNTECAETQITMISIPSGGEVKCFVDDGLTDGIEKGQIVRYLTLGGALCYIEELYDIPSGVFNDSPRVMRWQNDKPLVYAYYLRDNGTYLVDGATSEASTVVDNPTYSVAKAVIMQVSGQYVSFVTRGEYDANGGDIPKCERKVYDSTQTKVYQYNARNDSFEKKSLSDITTYGESKFENSEAVVITKNRRALGIIIY